jgi:hypothetical protein
MEEWQEELTKEGGEIYCLILSVKGISFKRNLQ